MQMDFFLTDHARKRCIKRKILEESIRATIDHLAKTDNDEDDPGLVQCAARYP